MLALSTVTFLGVGCSSSSPPAGSNPDDGVAQDEESVAGQLLVGLRDGKAVTPSLTAEIDAVGQVVDQNADGSVLLVALKDGVTREAAQAAIQHDDVQYTEPNFVAHPFAAGADPKWATQYSATVKGEVETAWGAWTAPVAASATATLSSVVANDTLTIAGHAFTAVANGAAGDQFDVGGDDSATATNLAAAITGSATAGIAGVVQATAQGAVVTVSAVTPGLGGNGITVVGGAHITVSGNLANGTGSPITVAVVDTGIRGDHEDLTHKMVAGRDVVAGAAINAGTNSDFGTYHGTQVAGIVAAEIGNSLGVAGIAATHAPAAQDPFAVTLMPVKVTDATHSANHLALAKGIQWAATNGAKVILLSLGSAAPSYTLQKAILAAKSAGCLVVAAAGNNGSALPKWPARYQNEGVLSVGAVDSTEALATDTNYGTWVNVLAPGVSLQTTDGSATNAYAGAGAIDAVSGTSYSAAFVAGAAALVWSKYPPVAEGTRGTDGCGGACTGKLMPSELRAILMQSVEGYGKPSATKSIQAGGGRLNVAKALSLAANQSLASPALLPVTIVLDAPSAVVGSTVNATVYLNRKNDTGSAVSIALDTSDHTLATTSATSVSIANGAISATFKVNALAAGTPNVTATKQGAPAISVPFKVTPPGLVSMTLSKTSVAGGSDVVATLKFNKAPSAAVPITFTAVDKDGNADAHFTFNAGQAYSFPAGKTQATVTIHTAIVAADDLNAVVTAADDATPANKASAKISVLAPQVLSVTLDKTSVTLWRDADARAAAGTPDQTLDGFSHVTVKMTGKVSADTTIYLFANDPLVSVPVSVTVPSGSDTSDGTAVAQPEPVVAQQTVLIYASKATTYNAATDKKATLKITPALSSFSVSPSSVMGAGSATGTVTLTGTAPVATSVAVAVDGTACPDDTDTSTAKVYISTATPHCTTSVTVGQGQKTASVPLATRASSLPVPAGVTATLLGLDKVATLTANAPTLASVTLASTKIPIGNVVTGTVTLSGAAVADTNVTVALRSTNQNKASLTDSSGGNAAVSKTVTITTGNATGSFYVLGNAAGTDAVDANVVGTTTKKSVNLTVNASTLNVALNGGSGGVVTVVGGLQTVAGTVSFGSAVTANTVVTLTASSAVVTGGTVTVTKGTSSKTFALTVPVASAQTANVTIQASIPSGEYKVATDTVTVNPTIASVTFAGAVVGRGTNTGKVTLGAAATADTTITLASGTVGVATVDANVVVSSGQTQSADFTVTGVGIGNSVITATYTSGSNTATGTGTVTVSGVPLVAGDLSATTLTLDSTTSPDSTVQLTIASAAPTGESCTATSSDTNVVTVTSPIAVTAGQTHANVAIQGVAPGTANVTVTCYGVTSNPVAVTAPALPTVATVASVATTSEVDVSGTGSTDLVQVDLSGPAPYGGAVVTLTSSNTNKFTVPASVTIPAGSTSGTFLVTGGATAGSATLTAAYGGSNATQTVWNLLVTLTSASNSDATSSISVGGSGSDTITVTLSSVAPTGGASITLASDDTNVATVPVSITINALSTSGTFAITGVNPGTATVTVTYLGAPYTVDVTVNP